MGRATWTLDEVTKVINKVYSTKERRVKYLSSIAANVQRTESDSNVISLSNIVRGLHNANTSTDKFLSVLLELDEL
jgi:hypothetical protein